mgnify:CR=1 FL=1
MVNGGAEGEHHRSSARYRTPHCTRRLRNEGSAAVEPKVFAEHFPRVAAIGFCLCHPAAMPAPKQVMTKAGAQLYTAADFRL